MISDLREILAQIEPVLNAGRYAFVSIADETLIGSHQIIASIREAEGLSLVIPEAVAKELGLTIRFLSAWITLTVHSDLSAIGLTAAFSTSLAKAGISCNVIAGVYHDHIFVPVEQAADAMIVLQSMQTTNAE